MRIDTDKQLSLRQAAMVEARDRIHVLFLNLQPREAFEDMGMKPELLIANFIGLPLDNITVVNVTDGDELPNTIEAHGIIGGGIHSNPKKDDWRPKLLPFLKAVHNSGIPTFDICASHQYKAKALGGEIALGDERFGIERYKLTPAGMNDPVLRGLPKEFDIFVSNTHFVKSLPPRDSRVNVLASSDYHPYEMLGYGTTGWSIQGHPDLAADDINKLARAKENRYQKEPSLKPYADKIQAYLETTQTSDYLRRAQQIAKNNRLIGNNWMRNVVAPYNSGVTGWI